MTDLEERVGRKVHEAWKSLKVQDGYAAHAWAGIRRQGPEGDPSTYSCAQCRLTYDKHHPDMVPWEALPEEKKQKYIVMGMAARAIGWDGGWHCKHCWRNWANG